MSLSPAAMQCQSSPISYIPTVLFTVYLIRRNLSVKLRQCHYIGRKQWTSPMKPGGSAWAWCTQAFEVLLSDIIRPYTKRLPHDGTEGGSRGYPWRSSLPYTVKPINPQKSSPPGFTASPERLYQQAAQQANQLRLFR